MKILKLLKMIILIPEFPRFHNKECEKRNLTFVVGIGLKVGKLIGRKSN